MSAPAEEIRQAVRRFAREQLVPNAARWESERIFPREALAGLAAMGLYAVAVPEQWGGAGLDYTALAIACEEMSAGHCATATIVSVNNLVAGILAGYGNDLQKQTFLRPLAEGKRLAAFALTEPHVGSDAAAIITRAERRGGEYVLNGTKQFITSGKNADFAVVFAVTDKGAGKKGISAFVVPTSTPGWIVARVEEKAGQHASDTAQIVLENCRVPLDHRLAEEGVGYRIALANLESGRINIAAQAVGMARAALDEALRFARDTELLGHERVRDRLEAMARKIRSARVYARNRDRLVGFCETMSRKLGIDVSPAESAEAAVRGAHIVNVITKSATPVLLGKWLEPGQHVNAAGSNALARREIDEEVVTKCDIVTVDGRGTARKESGDLLPAVEKGAIRWETLTEIGEVIAGRAPGRISATQTTLYESHGMGLQDLYVGAAVLGIARKKNVGTDLAVSG